MVPGENRPLSEIFHEAAEDWVDKQSAADLLEDTKSAVLAQMCIKLGDIAVNKAERTVKASPDWYDHVQKVIMAKKEANLAKVKLETIKMRFQEWQNAEANHRAGMKYL